MVCIHFVRIGMYVHVDIAFLTCVCRDKLNLPLRTYIWQASRRYIFLPVRMYCRSTYGALKNFGACCPIGILNFHYFFQIKETRGESMQKIWSKACNLIGEI